MTRPDLDLLLATAFAHNGYFTAAEAKACGVSAALLYHHARAGRLVHVRRGLYRFAAFPTGPHDDAIAAWLAAGEGAVVSHASALSLLGLGDVIPDAVHLTVPRRRRFLALPGATVHTVSEPIPAAEIVTREGVRATAAARSIWDAAEAGTAPEQILRAVREALRAGMALPDQFAPRGRYGRRANALMGRAIAANRRTGSTGSITDMGRAG